MRPRRWVNPHQPQTLYIAQLLLYFRGGFGLLFALLGARLTPFTLLITAGELIAAFGIANEMRWAYKLGVVVAAFPLALLLLAALTVDPAWLWSDLIGLMFDVALLALLLHSQSRNYQRYWRTSR